MIKITSNVNSVLDRLAKWKLAKIKLPSLYLTVEDTIHISNGRAISTRALARILSKGDPSHNLPPRPFLNDFARLYASRVSSLIRRSIKIRIRRDTTRLPTIVAELPNVDSVAMEIQLMFEQFLLVSGYYKSVAPNSPNTRKNAAMVYQYGLAQEHPGGLKMAIGEPPLVHTQQLLHSVTCVPFMDAQGAANRGAADATRKTKHTEIESTLINDTSDATVVG